MKTVARSLANPSDPRNWALRTPLGSHEIRCGARLARQISDTQQIFREEIAPCALREKHILLHRLVKLM